MPDDIGAIKQAALDYLEGWYRSDTARIERALHPEFVKRITFKKDRQEQFRSSDFATFKKGVEQVQKPEFDPDGFEVVVLDQYEHIASVKTVCAEYVDYLHLSRWNGEWKIINCLWAFTPETRVRHGLEKM